MADEFDNVINAFSRDDSASRWYEYKGSIKWYRLKNLALIHANNRCEYHETINGKQLRCKSRRLLELHHLKYPDNPNDDCLDNVIILCQYHHRNVGGFVDA